VGDRRVHISDMRAFLATTVATACAGAAAFLLPMAGPAAAHGERARDDARGATQVIALTRLAAPAGRRAAGTANLPVAEGLTSHTVKPFSLLGITWDDAGVQLDGTVEVRTRSRVHHTWSSWRSLPNNDDVPDRDSPERTNSRARGGTAPLWVGDADGVQVRVIPRVARAGGTAALPAGLRVDLVDPGAGTAPASGRARTMPVPRLIPAAPADTRAAVRTAPRPPIVTRSGWGADESLREHAFAYTGTVRAVFVHHTVTGNDYSCAQAPAVIRGIYRYHVASQGWRDIGYNFLIDKCGTIYEGRAGGVAQPVLGAHTLGFNNDSSGIALLGTFTKAKPTTAAVQALESLAAWKLSLSGVKADATTTLVSKGSGRFPAGHRVRFPTISGHRDAYPTDCPGARLYAQLPAIRKAAAARQP
jgi:hypothetical protein